MINPSTYSEWSNLLERFGNGDDSVLEAMKTGNFEIDSGTAVRFYSRVEEVYKKRKKSWVEKFQRSFQMYKFKTEEDFGIALRDGKQNLLPLSKFVSINGIPEDLRNTLHQDLIDFVAEIKKSLKDNVSKTNNNREKVLLMINSFGLFENQHEIQTMQNDKNQNQFNIIQPKYRKIIF